MKINAIFFNIFTAGWKRYKFLHGKGGKTFIDHSRCRVNDVLYVVNSSKVLLFKLKQELSYATIA